MCDVTTRRTEKSLMQYFHSETCLDPGLRLREDLGVDSLSLVELIVYLEDALQVEFSDSDLDPEELCTISSLFSLVGKAAQ